MSQNTNTGSSRRGTLITAVAGLLVLVVGIVAWRAMAGKPSPDASPDRLRDFIASEDFRKLPAQEKEKYAGSFQRIFQPGEVDQKAMRNMAELHRQKMLDDYFELPEGKARKDYLDKQIDEQERIRKMMENPDSGDGRVVIRRGGPSAAAQKELTETVPAEYQAKMAQYAKDMKDRRAERGLPTDAPMVMMMTVKSTQSH